MIRLRRAIDRGLANRWLRILLLILLVGLLAFVVFHGTEDAAADGAIFACVAVMALIFIVVVPQVAVRVARLLAPALRRGPPIRAAVALGGPLERCLSIPLRR